MQYKGFVAKYQYVSEAGLFVAEIFHAKDTLSFSAPTLKQLEEVMKEAVDEYLQFSTSLSTANPASHKAHFVTECD